MGVQSSIILRKDHVRALAAIGIIVETQDFPTTAQCLFCGETTLNIYEDVVRSDLWMACTNCPAAGNIITFAGAHWKLDTLATVDRFKELGINLRELSQANVAAALGYAQKDRASAHFWAQAADQLWTHVDDILALKFRDFGLSPELPCKGLAGVATAEQVKELCANIASGYPRKFKPAHPILVFPYCDLPRHYSGFLLAQYQDQFELKKAFVLTHIIRSGTNTIGAGYYLLEQAALSTHRAVSGSVFVVDDPYWALKAQTAQLRHGDALLPICASYSGKEVPSVGGSWASISSRKKFFYSQKITPELVSQAANARGYICALNAEGLPKPTQPAKTIKTLGRLYRSAVTWQKTLRHVFEHTNDIAAKSFFAKLAIPNEKLRDFFLNNPVVEKETAEDLLAKVTPVYFTSTESTQYSTRVVSRETGWFTGKNSMIANCAPVIETVVYTETDKYYAGYVKNQNKKIHFLTQADEIDNQGLLRYAERLMATQDEHVMYVPGWNRRSAITAMTLNPPEITHIRSAPGWDDDTQEFYCANYAINTESVIRALPYPELRKNREFDLPDPTTLAPESIYKLLTPSHENATTWAIFAAALANILAPVFKREYQSVAVSSTAFLATKEILQAIGVKERDITSAISSVTLSVRIKDVAWPCLFYANIPSDKSLSLAVARNPHTAAFLRVFPITTLAAVSHGWQAVTGPVHPPGIDYSALPYVAAGYIYHAVKNRLKFHAAKRNLTHEILADLNNWLAETYNSTFNLAHAENHFLIPGDEIVHLMRNINDAINAERITVIPVPRKKRQDGDYIIRTNEAWWINRRIVDSYCKAEGGFGLNWSGIADCFVKKGLLRGEKTINGMVGLLVDREWCDRFWTDYGDAAAKTVG